MTNTYTAISSSCFLFGGLTLFFETEDFFFFELPPIPRPPLLPLLVLLAFDFFSAASRLSSAFFLSSGLGDREGLEWDRDFDLPPADRRRLRDWWLRLLPRRLGLRLCDCGVREQIGIRISMGVICCCRNARSSRGGD